MELISAENGMSPSWSPDGSQIAFLSNRAEGWDLYVMPCDGGDAVRLTSGATADDPAWSPDGRWIAVERRQQIEAVSPGGAQREVLVGDPRHPARHPTWSPTMELAYVREQDLYVRSAEGEERLLLRDAAQPHWSPDGGAIAFVRSGICELDLASGQVRQRTRHLADTSPVIAADGDIIFVRNQALMILHADDSMSDLSHLSTPASAPALHPHDPDTIAYQLHDGGNWDIVIASLERGDTRRLTRATWTSWNARR